MMAAPLNPADIERLGKFLGMLGSDHEGERANAAMMADRLVRDRGTTWPALLEPLLASCGTPPSYLPHRRDALMCLDRSGLWTDKEFDFLLNISRKRKSPTPAQAIWLADLVDRARAYGAPS